MQYILIGDIWRWAFKFENNLVCSTLHKNIDLHFDLIDTSEIAWSQSVVL